MEGIQMFIGLFLFIRNLRDIKYCIQRIECLLKIDRFGFCFVDIYDLIKYINRLNI